jgi:hypothetical protein
MKKHKFCEESKENGKMRSLHKIVIRSPEAKRYTFGHLGMTTKIILKWR